MSGPKRNPDKLNTIGVVVVGICGAVLVYVTIVALQAFYMNDTSEIQTMADYGGQETTAKNHRAAEMGNITESAKNPGEPESFRIPITEAMKEVVESAKTDPSHLIPALPPSTKPTIEPVFGRPKPLPATPAPGAPAAGSGSAGSGSGSAGSGSAAAATPPTSPTGVAHEPQPVAGAGGVPTTGTPKAPKAPKTPKAPKAGAEKAGSAAGSGSAGSAAGAHGH